MPDLKLQFLMYSQCFIGKVHLERHGKKYHFSWLEVGENRKFTWEQARNYCRRFCMDAISIQSVAEYNTVKEQLRKSEYQGYRNRYNLIAKTMHGYYLHPICVAEYNTVKEQLRKSEYQGYRNRYNPIAEEDFAWML